MNTACWAFVPVLHLCFLLKSSSVLENYLTDKPYVPVPFTHSHSAAIFRDWEPRAAEPGRLEGSRFLLIKFLLLQALFETFSLADHARPTDLAIKPDPHSRNRAIMSRLPISKPFSFSTKRERPLDVPIISPHRVSKAFKTSKTSNAHRSLSTWKALESLRTSQAVRSLRTSKILKSSRTSNRPKSSSRPFRFLDLPPEIRNSIYTYAAPTAYLRATTKGRLASRSALPRVNHQIREEFLASLLSQS